MKKHVKAHLKIYLPLTVVVAIITSTIVTYANIDYADLSTDGSYTGPVWTPTVPASNHNSGSSNTTSGTSSTGSQSTTTTTEGCRSDLVPSGAKQVTVDKITKAVNYLDGGELIPEIIGGEYIYMKDSNGKADFNYIIGKLCKITSTQTWGYVYPEKIKSSQKAMEEEANKVLTPSQLARSLKCKDDVPASAVKVGFDKETYDVSYFDTEKLVPDVIGRWGASYLYMKDPETGEGNYDYVIGYTCGSDQVYGYIYPDVIKEDKIKMGITESTTSVATESVVETNSGSKTVPPAGYEGPVDSYSQNPFSDTDTSTLEGEAAASLYSRAVIGGYEDGEFKGDRPVNRAEAAKFLLLAKKITFEDSTNDGRFKDVPNGKWYTKYVLNAAHMGIINGYADGTFKPAETVSTVEFLKMLAVTFNLQENLEYTYSDVPPDKWFAKYVGIAQQYNLFPERTGSDLNPLKKLTRREVAIAIYRILQHLGE